MLTETSQVNADGEDAAHTGLLARLNRWGKERPHASLAFCVWLFGTQLLGSVLLLGVMIVTDAPWIPPVEFAMKGVLLLMPLGSILGIYLAARTPPAYQGSALQVLGILANGAYLLWGLSIWSDVLWGFLASGS
jgi:hypothetical protein